MVKKSSCCAGRPIIRLAAKGEPPIVPFSWDRVGKGYVCYDRRVNADTDEYRMPSRPNRVLDGEGKFAENIPYQIVSLLQGQIKIKPAAHQYPDDLAYFLRFNHTDYRKQFLYQPITDTHPDQSER